MCGRYYIEIEERVLRDIVRQTEENLRGEAVRTGEIRPTDIVPAVSASGLSLMQWGFPRYDGNGVVINARSETVGEKRMFAGPFNDTRCLLPASFYFEWRNEGTRKVKHRLYHPNAPVIYLAGIAKDYSDGLPPKFVILTRQAAPGISFVHDRMPVILPREKHEAWLYGSTGDALAVMSGAETQIEAVPA